MTKESEQRLTGSLQSFSRFLASVVALIGLLTLVGWVFDLESLKNSVPGTVGMKANSAICLVLASFALLLGSKPLTAWSRHAAQACAFVVVLIALVALAQHVTSLNLGIDRLLFSEPEEVIGTYHPGRMTPSTVFNFILAGIAIFLLSRGAPGGYRWAQALSVASGSIALFALTGYAYNIPSFTGMGYVTQMPVNAAVAFILFSVALFLSRPEHGLVSPIASPHTGGIMARRLSLGLITVPMVLGLLIGVGYHAGLYSGQVGASLMVTVSVLLLLGLVWIQARALNRTDVERGRAEEVLRKREAQYRAIVEEQTEAIVRFLPDGTITFANLAFARQHGQRPEKLIGRSFVTLPYMSEGEYEKLQARLACLTWEHPVVVFDNRTAMPNGEKRWHQWTIKAIFDEQQGFGEVQMVGIDVTERKSIEEQLEHQAFHDALTGLPNRVLFRDRLSHALARAKRNGSSVAVLFLDLDNFKVINDSLGHKVGDQLLVVVSKRLQECVRAEDTIARLGGDEFTVLLEDITDFHTAVTIAERIGEQLQVSVALGGPDKLRTTSSLDRHVFISSSIGIAMQSSLYEQPE
ncbi:MAG: sensor domain-containing diguanylate cyclase, partial [Chloroflexia bacterium]